MPGRLGITKDNLSEVLKGFQREPGTTAGYDIYTVRGWDYLALVDAYLEAAATARRDHVPAILHVTELTQPQGHSTSGSHERYKSRERLQWEEDFDPIRKLRAWMVAFIAFAYALSPGTAIPWAPATAAALTLKLEAGKTRIQTFLAESSGTTRGAFYVDVERVD